MREAFTDSHLGGGEGQNSEDDLAFHVEDRDAESLRRHQLELAIAHFTAKCTRAVESDASIREALLQTSTVCDPNAVSIEVSRPVLMV